MCFTVWLLMSECADFGVWMTDGMLTYQMEETHRKMHMKDCLHREEAERIRGRTRLARTDNNILLVAMRLRETPVPIPNTTVKT